MIDLVSHPDLARLHPFAVAPGEAVMSRAWVSAALGAWLASAYGFTHQSARAAKSFCSGSIQRHTGLRYAISSASFGIPFFKRVRPQAEPVNHLPSG